MVPRATKKDENGPLDASLYLSMRERRIFLGDFPMSRKSSRRESVQPTALTAALPLSIDFGRETTGDLSAAEQREWLVTNGLGGFASGTVAGLLTRRYHGLLVAALKPPLGRTLLVAKLDEIAEYDGQTYPLSTNRWASGTVDPHGYRHIERFHLEGTTPVWTFACADALLEKRVWMQQGANTTYVRYDLIRASQPLGLRLKALVNHRDFHSLTRAGDWRMKIEGAERGLRILPFEAGKPFYLLSRSATVELAHEWYRDFDLTAERCRGLDYCEDHLFAGTLRGRLQPGDSVTLVASTDPAPNLDGHSAYRERLARECRLLDQWEHAFPRVSRKAPPWVRQLVLAADQFIVERALPNQTQGRSVIAGYHWFGDWSRDTMIALPGLTLSTGRPEVARKILTTYTKFVDRGMLPNCFPESGDAAEHNTVDAALWFIEAVHQYYAATHDDTLLRMLFPVLADVVDCHLAGTRYNTHVDAEDGLLYAGEPGTPLTWMDAEVGKWVVTPRMGKAVELNALWYNALITMAGFARALKKSAGDYEAMAQRARTGFQRFWNASAGYCFDVIDGPAGDDTSLRPNQIFGVSLPASPLAPEQQRAVVDACARHLVTSHCLRSLAPRHPDYQGHYSGDQRQRDAAYHQGTAWGWLLGPFVIAHLQVYSDRALAASFLEPFAHHLKTHGLGTASEIFDGDAPFTPRGCIAQAWTVAEVLRAWMALGTH
jgi:predicted glycogen debranching enzyme